jgi:hypothetical protein
MATFSWEWGSGYESIPSDTLNRSLIDDALRNMRIGVRERMEPEHNWGPCADKDDGSHRGGYVTVLDKGDEAARDAVANMQDGALFLMQVGDDLQLQLYIAGTGWVQAGTLDHGALSNLDQNTHTQYLLKTGGVMAGDFNMGSYSLELATGLATQLGFVQIPHMDEEHPGLGNKAVVKDGDIGRAKLLWHTSANYWSPMGSERVYITVPKNAMVLCPNFYSALGAGRLYSRSTGGNNRQLIVTNTEYPSIDIVARFNFRYVYVVPL